MKILENEVKNKKKFDKGESSIGLVDIAGNFIAFWVPTVQEAVGWEILTREKYPKLCEWSDEFLSHTVVKENTPPKDKLYGLFKTLLGTSNKPST